MPSTAVPRVSRRFFFLASTATDLSLFMAARALSGVGSAITSTVGLAVVLDAARRGRSWFGWGAAVWFGNVIGLAAWWFRRRRYPITQRLSWARIAVVLVVAVHLVALALRWSRLHALVAMPLLALVILELAAVVLHRTTLAGPFPTGDTIRSIGEDLRTVIDHFTTAVAPVPDSGAYANTIALSLALVAAVSDTLAFRGGGRIEAVVPHAVLLVLTRIVIATSWRAHAVIAAHAATKSGAGDPEYFHVWAHMLERWPNLYGDTSAWNVPLRGRHAGIATTDQDVFVNAVGGVRIGEPAADLAVSLAIVSTIVNASYTMRSASERLPAQRTLFTICVTSTDR